MPTQLYNLALDYCWKWDSSFYLLKVSLKGLLLDKFMLKFRKFAIHRSFDHTRYFTKKELM